MQKKTMTDSQLLLKEHKSSLFYLNCTLWINFQKASFYKKKLKRIFQSQKLQRPQECKDQMRIIVPHSRANGNKAFVPCIPHSVSFSGT